MRLPPQPIARLAIIAGTFLAIFASAKGNEDEELDSGRVLQSLAGPSAKEELQIKYILKNTNEPRNAAQQAEENMKGVFVSTRDYYANRLQSNNTGVTFWNIRRGPVQYSFLGDDHVLISEDPEARRQDASVLAQAAVGSLGKLNEVLIETLKDGHISSNSADGIVTIQKGGLTVQATMHAGDIRLDSIDRKEPSHNQEERLVFEDYREVEGLSIPFKVTSIFANSSQRTTRVYEVKSVEFNANVHVPIMTGDFDLVDVADARFDPPVRYLALKQLPSDEQIKGWIGNPAALRQHNALLRKLARSQGR